MIKHTMSWVQCFSCPSHGIDKFIQNALSDSATIRMQDNSMSNVEFTTITWDETLFKNTFETSWQYLSRSCTQCLFPHGKGILPHGAWQCGETGTDPSHKRFLHSGNYWWYQDWSGLEGCEVSHWTQYAEVSVELGEDMYGRHHGFKWKSFVRQLVMVRQEVVFCNDKCPCIRAQVDHRRVDTHQTQEQIDTTICWKNCLSDGNLVLRKVILGWVSSPCYDFKTWQTW